MPITKDNELELNQLFSEYKSRFQGRKEDYFALQYLMKKFRVTAEEVGHQVAFGGNDYGVDAYFVDRETKNLYIFQFKWSENHGLFKDSLERLSSDGLRLIFDSPNADTNKNEVLSFLHSDLLENRNLIEKVYLHFVFKGDQDAAENSSGLQARREALENKEYLIRSFFDNRDVKFIVEFVADRRAPARASQTETYSLHISQTISFSHPNGENHLYCGFVPLMDVFGIYKGLQYKFFSRNIRAGLSAENPPNKRIREALYAIAVKKAEEPEMFCFNHNGITIVAEKFQAPSADGVAQLYSPRLLNGAQTITSLAKFIEEHQDNPALDRSLLARVTVLAKVVCARVESDFVRNVTIANNQQNPVESWQLHANDNIQCDLQDKFATDVRIYYSRQENAFETLAWDELEELGIEEDKDIKLKKLTQVFLAVRGEIDNISRISHVFETPSLYDSVFDKSCLHWDTRRIVLGYKCLLMLNPIVRSMEESSSDRMYEVVRHSRNLIFTLLIQGMLNHKSLNAWAEDYGKKLTKDTYFKEELKKVATSRILPLIRAFVNEDANKKKIADGRFAFMSSKDSFRKVMRMAQERYDWTIKKAF